jgi:hypothetical protein
VGQPHQHAKETIMQPNTSHCARNSLFLAALSLSVPMQVHADISLEGLQQQISDLAQTNRQQEQRIRQLEQQLAALSRRDGQVAATSTGSNGLGSRSPGPDTAANATAMAGNNGPALPVVSEVPKSVEDIYQEASGLPPASSPSNRASPTPITTPASWCSMAFWRWIPSFWAISTWTRWSATA